MRYKKQKKGNAYFFTLLFLILFASFSLVLLELAHASSKLSRTHEFISESENCAQSGVNYFVYQASKLSLLGKKPDQIYEILKGQLNKKMYFENQGGWFELIDVEKIKDDFLFQVRTSLPSIAIAKAPQELSFFVENTYAQTPTLGTSYECLTGAQKKYWGGLGVVSPTLDGGFNPIDAYGGAKGYVITDNLNPKLDLQGVERKTGSPNMDELKAKVDAMVASAKSFFNYGSQDPLAPANNCWLGTDVDQHQAGSTCSNAQTNQEYTTSVFTSLKNLNGVSGPLHFQEPVVFDSNTILGDIYGGTFTYARFEKTASINAGTTLRFGPGMYFFKSSFLFTGNNPQLILDVTHGPVHFIFDEGSQLKVDSVSNNMAILVHHSDSENYSTYEKKIDKEQQFNYFGKKGRKIAMMFFDKYANIALPVGNNSGLFGGFAVGSGMDALPAMPATGYQGNECYKNGQKWEIVPGTTAPTTEHFQIWAKGDCNESFSFDRNNIQFIGLIMAPGRDIIFSKQNIDVYGVLVGKKVSIDQNNTRFHIDTRVEPLPVEIIGGTYHIKYKQKIN